MRAQSTYKEPVSFIFGDYEVVVKWNDFVLGYDAEIWRTKSSNKWLVTKTGGKTVEQASMSARQLIMGKELVELIDV